MTEIQKLVGGIETRYGVKLPKQVNEYAQNGKKSFAFFFPLGKLTVDIKYAPPREQYGAFMTATVRNGCLIGVFAGADNLLERLDGFLPKHEHGGKR